MCTSKSRHSRDAATRPGPLFRWLLVGSLFLTGVIVGGCGRRELPADAAVRHQTLLVSIPGEPSELDPHIINAPPDFDVIQAFFEGLVVAHPKTLQAEPGVAERWDVSDDRLTYTFHLRENARWSNGDPVTAHDFVYSFRRALTPSLGSQYTFLFSAIVGAEDFAAGRVTDFDQVGIEAADARTVRLTLRRPTPYFLEIMANNPVFYPVHPPTVERVGGFDQRGSGWTRPEHFVGNGPFTLATWRPNEVIVARKSSTYRAADEVRLQAVHFHSYDSVEAQERAFRAGQLHLTDRVPLAKIDVYRSQDPSPLLAHDMLMVRFVNVNTERPPLDDPRVRQALARALDRRLLAEKVFHSAATPAFQLVPDGMPRYLPRQRIVEDAPAAQQLLAEAGYPGGSGFPALELQVESGASSQLDQALQARWREVLGIDVRIVRSESRVHWSNLQRRDFQLSIGGWVADYPDATAFLDLWTQASGWNFTGWSAAAYDAILEQANQASAAEERLAHLQRAESMLLEAMPVLPVWFERNLRLVHPAVRNWIPNVMERPQYAPVYLEN